MKIIKLIFTLVLIGGIFGPINAMDKPIDATNTDKQYSNLAKNSSVWGYLQQRKKDLKGGWLELLSHAFFAKTTNPDIKRKKDEIDDHSDIMEKLVETGKSAQQRYLAAKTSTEEKYLTAKTSAQQKYLAVKTLSGQVKDLSVRAGKYSYENPAVIASGLAIPVAGLYTLYNAVNFGSLPGVIHGLGTIGIAGYYGAPLAIGAVLMSSQVLKGNNFVKPALNFMAENPASVIGGLYAASNVLPLFAGAGSFGVSYAMPIATVCSLASGVHKLGVYTTNKVSKKIKKELGIPKNKDLLEAGKEKLKEELGIPKGEPFGKYVKVDVLGGNATDPLSVVVTKKAVKEVGKVTDAVVEGFAKDVLHKDPNKSLGQFVKEETQKQVNDLLEKDPNQSYGDFFGRTIEKQTNDLLQKDPKQTMLQFFAQKLDDFLEKDPNQPMIKFIEQQINSELNYTNAAKYGGIAALAIALPVTGWYGTKTMWNIFEKKMLTPAAPVIILPGKTYGYIDRLKRYLSGYKTPPMILDKQVKARLKEITRQTKNIRDNIRKGKKVTYSNLLLHGRPGTGKTFFARALADETDMDFLATTAASLLQSGVQGIKYFNDIMTMANKSKYGLILFIDEADSLFVDRNLLSPDSDHYKVLEYILSMLEGNNKFMLVAATNHSYVMDEAMGRRFQDRVLMPLPDADTRFELLQLYCNIELCNEKEQGREFARQAAYLLTDELMQSIVQKTDGLSHAEIKDMVQAMRKKALATKNGMITAVHILDSVTQAIEKRAATEAERQQREANARFKKDN